MTRREIASRKIDEKTSVDIRSMNPLASGSQTSGRKDKANDKAEGKTRRKDKADWEDRPIRIGEVFWDDFLTVSKVLVGMDSEATFYDVFLFIRDHFNGCQPLSQATIDRADHAVARDFGPWDG